MLADSDKGSWYDKTNLLEGNFEEPFSVQTDEESCDDDETDEVHWVKPPASLYLVDPRILEANMQTAAICKEWYGNLQILANENQRQGLGIRRVIQCINDQCPSRSTRKPFAISY